LPKSRIAPQTFAAGTSITISLTIEAIYAVLMVVFSTGTAIGSALGVSTLRR
jgi:hypothetical protein